jgi:hypothetical protein
LTRATITDPTHPLYRKTFPIVETISPHNNAEFLIIELADGQNRKIPRSSTDLEKRDDSSPSSNDLPLISIRTIIPITRFVCCKQIKPGEGNNANTSGTGAAGRTRRGRPTARSASGVMAEVEVRSSEPTGEMLGQPNSPNEATKGRRKGG